MDFSITAKTATLLHMANYLKLTGRPTKRHFTCLSMQLGTPNAHPDNNPSMNYNPHNGTVHCHQCGLTLDLLDLIGIDNNITDKREQLRKAKELFPDIKDMGKDGKPITAKAEPKNTALNWNSPIKASPREEPAIIPAEVVLKERDYRTPEQVEHDKDLFRLCAENCEENPDGVRAWARRGITTGTIERFQLGYESNYPYFRRTPGTGTDGKPPFKGFNAQMLAIPHLDLKGAGVLRNLAKGIDKKDRFDTRGPKRPYNLPALLEESEYIFITEGEIDGLSVYESGYDSFVSLGGVENAKQLIKELERPEVPGKSLIILLDNDKAGEKATNEILEALGNTSKYLCYVPKGFYPEHVKDINEYLVTDPDGLREALGRTIKEAQDAKEQAIKEQAEAYTNETSVLGFIDEFTKNLGKPDTTPIYPTGFQLADNFYFNGGLHGQSLIIIGALSSAGKTTFIHQIADNIAESGRDVMIFSLEMSKSELIAKSISRLTFKKVEEEKGELNHAKTVYGVLDGKRYSGYSQNEIDLIYHATEYYKKVIGPHMYVFEGMGNVTVIPAGYDQPSIGERVQRHIEITGRRPVIIVDYLQILAPINDRATDKQNTDKNVLELKRIARDFNIPVIAISSMNRDSYNAPITFSSFKESGAVEYSSDILLGLQFNGQSDKKKKGKVDIEEAKRDTPRKMELKLIKNRNGQMSTTIIYYEFYPQFNYFKELGLLAPEQVEESDPDGVAIETKGKKKKSKPKPEEEEPEAPTTEPEERPLINVVDLYK